MDRNGTPPVSGTYREQFERFRALGAKYGAALSGAQMVEALGRASAAVFANPYIQNRRVKAVPSLPRQYSKDQVGEMVRDPGGNERALREVSHALEHTAYPYRKVRKTYTDLMTYRWYNRPAYLEAGDGEDPALLREWRLVEKLCQSIRPTETAHRLAGEAIQEGKVFYALRYEVDKSHNAVRHAFLQRLPSDWVKIVGYNDVSGYTVAFNLFYLFQPGCDHRQFGDLLTPYLDDFDAVLVKQESDARYCAGFRDGNGNRVGVDFKKFGEIRRCAAGKPELYVQNGEWAYWVTLPPERVWVFECDDAVVEAAPPMMGLFLSMLSIAQYEQVQLELVQNPLISVMTGEIPYRSDNEASQEDMYKLSNDGRNYWEALWYDMLAQNNTSGLGFFLAPANNLKLHQLSEVPSAGDVSAKGYAYTIEKAGLAGLMPINDNPRAGVVNVSTAIESRYCQTVYWQFGRMMERLYRDLGLRYHWRFVMFGDIFSDEKLLKDMQKSMSVGVLPDLFLYNALLGRSLLDDVDMSRVVKASGVLDLRIPLITSYTMKQDTGGLPPQAGGGEPGRPKVGIEDVEHEGTEEMLDG